MTCWIALLVLACGLGPQAPPSALQEAPESAPLVPGSRVRVRAPSVPGHRFQGTLVGLDQRSLVVDVGKGALVSVPRQAVAELEISVGRPRRTLRGLVLGTAVGAAAFALLPPSDRCDVWPCWSSRPTGALVGGYFGAFYGSLIGTFVRRDRWSPVTWTEGSPGAARGRPGDGLVFALSFSF